MALAAGPEWMVSTGVRAANSSLISVPSPRTTISGASIWRRSMARRTAMTKSCSTASSEALRAAVVARSTEPSRVESWWPSTTGRSQTLEMAL
ncbi:MAG: hypothetical protein GWN58_40060 [Anaerolineae bacterium]|nr:hypothetical protein [Anaerolineae bacterium]